ncbi:MAG: hypothetical protein GX757_03870 [Clostridiales bacterium]|nr:hypothetical protein [Clostridiales bacterium]
MNAGFAVALIIMLLMLVFAFIIIRIIAYYTGNRIRDYAVEQMQAYDMLIRKKTEELNEIKNQLDAEKKKAAQKDMLQIDDKEIPEVFAPPFAEYRNYELFSDYRRIKENFQYTEEDIKEQVELLLQDTQNDNRYQSLESLLLKLNNDNVYKISSLQPEEQLELISEIVNDDEKSLLNEYMADCKEFSCIDFCQWLYVQRVLSDNSIRIRCSQDCEITALKSKLVSIEPDQGLCEGFQIFRGNKLYDFGIRISELMN